MCGGGIHSRLLLLWGGMMTLQPLRWGRYCHGCGDGAPAWHQSPHVLHPSSGPPLDLTSEQHGGVVGSRIAAGSQQWGMQGQGGSVAFGHLSRIQSWSFLPPWTPWCGQDTLQLGPASHMCRREQGSSAPVIRSAVLKGLFDLCNYSCPIFLHVFF